jgi:hypothetical protein
MGIWQTNKASFKVNIGQSLIGKFKKKGSKFCWIRDNNNVSLFINKEETEEETKEVSVFEVITSDGDTVKGYINHIVNGWCSGSPHTNWFIICPEENIVVEEL